MRVLVTGGAGYVGSAIVEALLESRHQVAVFDNFSTGHREAIAGIDVAIVEGDLADREAIGGALKQFRTQAVIHTAGSIEATRSRREGSGTIDSGRVRAPQLQTAS